MKPFPAGAVPQVVALPVPVTSHPALFLALLLLLHHGLRSFSISISPDTMGGHQCLRVTSSVVRLTDFWSIGEKGEKGPGKAFYPSVVAAHPLSHLNATEETFSGYPQSLVQEPSGFTEKKPVRELRLLYHSPRGFLLSCQRTLSLQQFTSCLSLTLVTRVSLRYVSCSNVLSLEPGPFVCHETQDYDLCKENCEPVCPHSHLKAGSWSPAFYLHMKKYLFVSWLKTFGPGSVWYYRGQVLTSPLVSSSLSSQNYIIIENQIGQWIGRCLGIYRALYICRIII